MSPTLPLFDLSLMNTTQEDCVAQMLDHNTPATAAFMNAHCANVAARDPHYREALKEADFVLPDGVGMALAAKMTGQTIAHNLNGTDLCAPLCKAARQRGLSVFLLGAKLGVAAKAARSLCAKHPGLRIIGAQDGYFNESETDAVIAQINQSGADIVMVAMGVPHQDIWIHNYRSRLKARLVLGVGALFDFEAGTIARAPAPLRRARLEWAWRLGMEPRRMASRYLLGNPMFMVRAFKHALARRNPARWSPYKRALDVTLSGAAILGLSPILLATALMVRLTSAGPVIYRQTRIGKDGAEFEMYKFRSMHVDAEKRRAALTEQSEREGVCFKMRNDPRLTAVGGFIRRYSLDELPQLFNVLKGTMSLVGPRPALPQEVAAYPKGARKRLSAMPGITGLWQVSGRANIGFDHMVRMDLAYARSRSIWVDVLLLALTVRAVIGARGAY